MCYFLKAKRSWATCSHFHWASSALERAEQDVLAEVVQIAFVRVVVGRVELRAELPSVASHLRHHHFLRDCWDCHRKLLQPPQPAS